MTDLFDQPRNTKAMPEGIPDEVCKLFEETALEVIAADYSRFSSDAILHHIRWKKRIDYRDRAFKINDHWSSVLARWFLARHPEYPKFFELRERVDDGYREDAA